MKRVRLTNERVNSYGFRVLTSGIDLEQFHRNPVLLYMHERGNVIGYVDNLETEGDALTAELVFDEAGETSSRCKKQFEAGSLRMVSIGIAPYEVSDDRSLLLPGQTRGTVTKCRLVEVSLVDIGANDDAIVMNADGTQLNLSMDGSSLLPLINNPLNSTQMDFKEIVKKLAMPETADEAAILNRIAELQADSAALSTLRSENASLRLAAIEQAVDAAIAAKKITPDKRGHFIELGKKVDAETFQTTLDAMAVQQKPTDLINLSNQGAGQTEWKKLSDVPSTELLRLRQEQKDEYRRLFRAEYGMECPELM